MRDKEVTASSWTPSTVDQVGVRSLVATESGCERQQVTRQAAALDQYITDGRIQKEPFSLVWLGSLTAIGQLCSAYDLRLTKSSPFDLDRQDQGLPTHL